MNSIRSGISGVFAVSIAYCIVNYVGRPVFAQGASMSPTINPHSEQLSDMLMVNSLARQKTLPGDIVTLTSPSEPTKSFVKRLIAMPGEWVYYKNIPYKIPEGHCWVQGDNIYNSYDSRNFGPVPLNLISGRVEAIVFPPSRMKKVHNDSSFRNSIVLDPEFAEGVLKYQSQKYHNTVDPFEIDNLEELIETSVRKSAINIINSTDL